MNMALSISISLLALATELVHAQSDYYTVWSSVIFSRTGERTPTILGDIPTQLTSLGAQEAFSSGSFFRTRYLTGNGSTDGVGGALLYGLDQYEIDPQQVYVQALDYQWTIATAQAWMQGFYPPLDLNITGDQVTGVASSGSYFQSPLKGYRYPQIHAAGGTDAEFPYIGAQLDCPGSDVQIALYQESPQFVQTSEESAAMYQILGSAVLSDVLDPDQDSYYNAYAIYDYLNYLNSYNSTIYGLLQSSNYVDPSNGISYFNASKWYADQQQYGAFSNVSQINTYTSEGVLDGSVTGSISTLPGNFLAAKLLGLLQSAVEYQGEYYKLNLLVGDFEPLLSLFALTGLPERNMNFFGLPDFASVAAFELYSIGDYNSTSSFPDESELLVRFYFRNGTDLNDPGVNDIYQYYPLFGRDPNQADMSWSDFNDLMSGIADGDLNDWCTQCGAEQIFCAAFNTSLQVQTQTTQAQSTNHDTVSPAVAGVIGAFVALAFMTLIALAAILIGRLRFHRAPPRAHKNGMVGFRGSRKMQSDQDLSIPKTGGAGATVVETEDAMSPPAHERVGSWELKNQGLDAGKLAPEMEEQQNHERLSFEIRGEPVRAEERV